MKINITGDFFISAKIDEPSYLIKNISQFFKNSDFNIVNLESPVTNSGKQHRILKTGPHLNGHPATFNLLNLINIKLVTLANNHIMDFGRRGLEDTLNGLESNKINYVGAGLNLKEATKAFTFNKDNLKIGILNFTENEFSIAEDEEPGANPLDIIDNINQLKALKKDHDKVIVIIHGGHEYYQLPSPRMVKQYRFYADNGADVIIGHHSHCISGYEIYNNVPIFYSLGNFLFTFHSKHESWYTGLLIQLEISKSKDITFKVLPLLQEKSNFKVELMKGFDKREIIEKIERYNFIIADKKLNQQNWINYLNQNSKQFLNSFSPVNLIENRYIRAGFRRLNFDKLILRKQNLKEILNYISCEALVDGSKQVIKDFLKK